MIPASQLVRRRGSLQPRRIGFPFGTSSQRMRATDLCNRTTEIIDSTQPSYLSKSSCLSENKPLTPAAATLRPQPNRRKTMKKLKLAVTTLCLVAALGFGVPSTAYAEEGGPQGTSNSAPKAPAPTIDWAAVMLALM